MHLILVPALLGFPREAPMGSPPRRSSFIAWAPFVT